MTALDISRRPRRNRKTAAIRDLIEETTLLARDFICPFFVIEGVGIKQEIEPLPGVYRWSLDLLLGEIERLSFLGLKGVMLFPVIQEHLKDHAGTYALNENNILCTAIRRIKKSFPNLCLISDIALDPYTSHGHDGLVYGGDVLNDESVFVFGKIAVLHAEMGVDIVAPSDMMDGRVGYMRSQLDRYGFHQTLILSYSVKYASSLYSPFRNVLNSSLRFGDKRSYQMNPANVLEALLECSLDEEEGADMLMIKPAGFYLDVISQVRRQTTLPVVGYQVSGEYAMIMAAADRGWVEKDLVLHESVLAIKRAGANMMISYATPMLLESLKAQVL